MNIIENIEKEQMEKLLEGKNLPNFKPGDTLRVHTKVKEGDRERIRPQNFFRRGCRKSIPAVFAECCED